MRKTDWLRTRIGRETFSYSKTDTSENKQKLNTAENLFESKTKVEDEEGEDLEMQRLRTELRLLSHLKKDFEDYYSTILAFELNSSRCDIKLIKEYLLHHFLIEQDVVLSDSNM